MVAVAENHKYSDITLYHKRTDVELRALKSLLRWRYRLNETESFHAQAVDLTNPRTGLHFQYKVSGWLAWD